MKLGFTGNRIGMSDAQKQALRDYLLANAHALIEFHHGDCVGSDEQAHNIVRDTLPTLYIVVHPPVDDRFRAWCQGHRILAPKPYLERNRDIVDDSTDMFSTPLTKEEQLRSGTWATIRYARKNEKPVEVCLP